MKSKHRFEVSWTNTKQIKKWLIVPGLFPPPTTDPHDLYVLSLSLALDQLLDTFPDIDWLCTC